MAGPVTILYIAWVAGAGGLVLCMPTVRPDGKRLRWAGLIVALGGLVGIASQWLAWIGDQPGCGYFIAFASIAVIAAACVVVQSRPVYSALYFMLVVLAVAGLCVLVTAEFLGAALVIVYGGAILVTYIFVIMLAQQATQSTYDTTAHTPIAATVIGFALIAATTQAMAPNAASTRKQNVDVQHAVMNTPVETTTVSDESKPQAASQSVGNTKAIGMSLMQGYVVAIEVAGVLLLIAMVGALIIARKRIEPEAMTPGELAVARQEQDLHRRGREAAPF